MECFCLSPFFICHTHTHSHTHLSKDTPSGQRFLCVRILLNFNRINIYFCTRTKTNNNTNNNNNNRIMRTSSNHFKAIKFKPMQFRGAFHIFVRDETVTVENEINNFSIIIRILLLQDQTFPNDWDSFRKFPLKLHIRF